MGQRNRSESVVAVFQAFLTQRTWLQPELARAVGIQVPALKTVLDDLALHGFPLEKDDENPTMIYWSLPNDWFPGGAFFTGEELQVLLRQLACLPASGERNRLMDAAARCVAGQANLPETLRSVVSLPKLDRNEDAFRVLLDSARTKVTVKARYYSESKGRESERCFSVHRIYPSNAQRFVATCHRSGGLKWFRVDGVRSAVLDPSQPYRDALLPVLDAFESASVDGFRGEGEVRELSFVVTEPEARWIAKNLPDGMRATELDAGVRVTARTAAVSQVARFVVGLGAAARPESPELAAAVAGLARDALAGAEATLNSGNLSK